MPYIKQYVDTAEADAIQTAATDATNKANEAQAATEEIAAIANTALEESLLQLITDNNINADNNISTDTNSEANATQEDVDASQASEVIDTTQPPSLLSDDPI